MTVRQSGWVYEVFTSIQGEGLYCGQRQTFVRLAGCNLDCDYCDTPAARDARPPACRVWHFPEIEVFDVVRNPIEVGAVVEACRGLGARVISLTGGEPLLQTDFAAGLLHELKGSGFATHLETNGTLVEAMARVAADVDVVAMDIKLPSAGGASTRPETHLEFLRAARSTGVFVKAVVGARTTPDEIAHWAKSIAEVGVDIPLVLQPVMGRELITGRHLIELQAAALAELDEVRVIPQCHKVLGLL